MSAEGGKADFSLLKDPKKWRGNGLHVQNLEWCTNILKMLIIFSWAIWKVQTYICNAQYVDQKKNSKNKKVISQKNEKQRQVSETNFIVKLELLVLIVIQKEKGWRAHKLPTIPPSL